MLDQVLTHCTKVLQSLGLLDNGWWVHSLEHCSSFGVKAILDVTEDMLDSRARKQDFATILVIVAGVCASKRLGRRVQREAKLRQDLLNPGKGCFARPLATVVRSDGYTSIKYCLQALRTSLRTHTLLLGSSNMFELSPYQRYYNNMFENCKAFMV